MSKCTKCQLWRQDTAFLRYAFGKDYEDKTDEDLRCMWNLFNGKQLYIGENENVAYHASTMQSLYSSFLIKKKELEVAIELAHKDLRDRYC